MQRSKHIFLLILAIVLGLIDHGYADNKQSIATGEFLSVLAKNVATVLSPTLVGELNDGRPNRTIVNGTAGLRASTTASPSKIAELTTESSKLFDFESDTVRSAQTQSEVRPGNNEFPFNFDENNYRYNYPGVNSQGFPGRPDFLPGQFNNPGYYNPDVYRGYGVQAGSEVNSQRGGETVGGVAPVETVNDGQTGRSPDSLEPSGGNLERFRNFERFPFNNQYSGPPGNFPNGPFSSSRQEGRFGQSVIDGFNPNVQGNPNFGNYRNPIGNNYQRNLFQPSSDIFQQRQQGFRSNNFDFLPSQRFQNSFDNYPRSLQRGPNFPIFHSIPYVQGLREAENFVPTVSRIDLKKIEETTSSEVKRKSELSKNSTVVADSTVNNDTTSKGPEILSVQGKIRFGRLLLPTLDDYDDLRFRPDDFREYLFTPNNKNNTEAKNNNGAANDI